MELDLFQQALLLLLSFIANLFSALAGGGAGLIQLPVIIFLGLPFTAALATHKVASVALGVGATFRHLKSSSLERRFALFILATGLPGVVVGAMVILDIPESAAKITLGLLTSSLGIYSYFQRQLGTRFEPIHRNVFGLVIGGLVLFFIGFLNGSLSSGTGLFVTLWLVRWFGLDYTRAVAYTLILVGMLWNGTGALTLGLQGQIQWNWLPALLLGSLLGGYFGTHIGLSKGNKIIKKSFEISTLAVGLSLVIHGFS